MLRLILGIVLASVVMAVVGHSGLVPHGLARLMIHASNFVFSLLCPLWLMSLFLVPGWYVASAESLRAWGARLAGQRDLIDDLKRKIAHMDKPHHMLQLGQLYLRQGKIKEASTWFEKCLAREPENLEASYGLAQCRFARSEYPAAAELLEKVHAVRPEHDYGLAYLRLAQAQRRSGHPERAAEVLRQMLRFYPGHPEASYESALLAADQGEPAEARRLMEEVVFSVRHSPRFQRRRNRHWALKARFWLWRHGRGRE